MRNKSDAKQRNMEEKELKLSDTKEENKTPFVEHVDNFEGPITRSKPRRWKMYYYSKPMS